MRGEKNIMSNVSEIKASLREKVGTGESRMHRRNNKVPCIIYGEKKDPLSINIDIKILKKELENPGFFSKQFDLNVDGNKHRVLAKDIQLHPVKESLVHIDFLRIGENTKVTVFVPVKFINENLCDGLKQGGVINVVRREVEIKSPVTSIPSVLEADLTGLQIGDSIHISSIKLSDDVKPVISDRDFTIATIAPPTVMKVEEDKVDDETEETDSKESATESEKQDDKKDEGKQSEEKKEN